MSRKGPPAETAETASAGDAEGGSASAAADFDYEAARDELGDDDGDDFEAEGEGDSGDGEEEPYGREERQPEAREDTSEENLGNLRRRLARLDAELAESRKREERFLALMERVQKGREPKQQEQEGERDPFALPKLKDQYDSPLEELAALRERDRVREARELADAERRVHEDRARSQRAERRRQEDTYIGSVTQAVREHLSDADVPLVANAFGHLINERAQELFEENFDPQQHDHQATVEWALRQASLKLHRRVASALRQGQDPAKLIFEQAGRYGWQRPAAEGGKPNGKANGKTELDRRQRAAKADNPMAGAGGKQRSSVGSLDEFLAEAENMSDADLDRFVGKFVDLS